MLKGQACNHGYWQSRGSIELNGQSDKSSDSSAHLPFLRCAATWLKLSPSLSQPISFPATGSGRAQLSIELLCCVSDRELQWEALDRSVWRSSLEILQVLFFKPRLCKSPSTPSLTSLLPCVLTPSTTFSFWLCELLTLPCLRPLWRRVAFPEFPKECGQCAYSPLQQGYGWYLAGVQDTPTCPILLDLVQMCLPNHMAPGTKRCGSKCQD